MWRKGNPTHYWWECKLVQPLQKTVWNVLKKLKIELPNDLVIPLPGISLKKIKTPIQDDIWAFPGSLVVKNPLCSAGDMGLIPGQRTTIPQAMEQ